MQRKKRQAVLGALTALLTLAACSWLLPLVVAARRAAAPLLALAACGAAAAALLLAAPAHRAYSPAAPHRLMAFHVRRTVHEAGAPPRSDRHYWLPHMDENAERVRRHCGGALAAARPLTAADCAAWPYCGAPYYLPVLGLVPRSARAPAAAAPLARLRVSVERTPVNATLERVRVRAAGEAHVALVLGLSAEARLAGCSALAEPRRGARWAGRGDTYFFMLHEARGGDAARFDVTFEVAGPRGAAGCALSVAGHGLARGAAGRAAEHAALLRALPDWTAPTGWGVDLHLYRL